MPVPPLAAVWSIPLRTRFRGLVVRDGALIRGDAGWGEFSPFWDYDDDESRRWWLAAREAADEGWPAPVRTSVPVNVTVPAVDPSSGEGMHPGRERHARPAPQQEHLDAGLGRLDQQDGGRAAWPSRLPRLARQQTRHHGPLLLVNCEPV